MAILKIGTRSKGKKYKGRKEGFTLNDLKKVAKQLERLDKLNTQPIEINNGTIRLIIYKTDEQRDEIIKRLEAEGFVKQYTDGIPEAWSKTIEKKPIKEMLAYEKSKRTKKRTVKRG